MPIRTKEELINNPLYLKEGETLVESVEGLEALSTKEKVSVITDLLLNTSSKEADAFEEHCEDLGFLAANDEKTSFHRLFAIGLRVRKQIASLTDETNPAPNQCFLSGEFNADDHHRFSELSTCLINANCDAIAIRLAITTQKDDRRLLMRNIRTGLEKSNLVNAMNAAILLSDLLETLNSESPENMFTSKEFNPVLFERFPEPVAKFLQGREKDIAEKLAKAPAELHKSIAECLEELMYVADNVKNPFGVIQSTFLNLTDMTPKERLVAPRDGIFGKPVQQPSIKKEEIEALDNELGTEFSSMVLPCPCTLF